MKHILKSLAIIICCLVSSSLYGQQGSRYVLNDKEFEVIFDTTWTLDDIVAVKKELGMHDIALSFSLLEFDENGLLKRLTASIKFKDGLEASFTSRELKIPDGPAFRRDFIKRPYAKE